MARGSWAPATTARSSRSIATAAARCSTTAPKWKCTPSRRRRMAGSMSAPRPMGASIASMPAGQATPFFDPDDKYIWSLIVDRDGNVFAGTGDKGTVYKITPDGKGAKFFASKTAHAVSLAFDQNRQLLVGTGAPGRVFRVDAVGQGLPASRHDLPGDSRDSRRSEGRPLRGRAKRPRTGRRLAARDRGDASAGDALDPERLHRDHLDHRRRCRRLAIRQRSACRRASQHR